MGLFIGLIVAFFIGLGAYSGAQHLWVSAVTSQITAQPQTPMLPQGPVLPTMTFNAEQLTKSLNQTIGPIDTTAGQRAAINNLGHQIYLQNRAAAAMVPLPPQRIPGLPR
ncbi:MAG: hypothetical protein E6G81_08580 [Alphaproteobacteria bacterium]|nr:MAG: hypothetical protein E6G81_08580 [Alphaproteobacteria bacterium]